MFQNHFLLDISDYKYIWSNKRIILLQEIGLWHNQEKQEYHTIVCRYDPWCNCDKQECQGFLFLHDVICDTSTISVNVRVLLGE